MNPVFHAPSTPNRALIKQFRAFFGLSQRDLAAKSGLSLPTIARIECGILTNPTLETLNAIAKVFNINTAQLLFTEVSEPDNFKLAEQLATHNRSRE